MTLVCNLAAGFAMAGMIVVALPEVHDAAVKAGSHYAHLGVSWRSFFLAVLAGAVITLLTRMQHATEAIGPALVAAVMMSFVLVGAQLFHSVLDSILMFCGLLTGKADYGYLDWLGALGWSAFGNLVGGLVLVTAAPPAAGAAPGRGEPRAGSDRLRSAPRRCVIRMVASRHQFV